MTICMKRWNHKCMYIVKNFVIFTKLLVETMITKTFTITFKCFFKVQAISYIIYSFELVLTFLEISSVVRYSLYANLCDQHDYLF